MDTQVIINGLLEFDKVINERNNIINNKIKELLPLTFDDVYNEIKLKLNETIVRLLKRDKEILDGKKFYNIEFSWWNKKQRIKFENGIISERRYRGWHYNEIDLLGLISYNKIFLEYFLGKNKAEILLEIIENIKKQLNNTTTFNKILINRKINPIEINRFSFNVDYSDDDEEENIRNNKFNITHILLNVETKDYRLSFNNKDYLIKVDLINDNLYDIILETLELNKDFLINHTIKLKEFIEKINKRLNKIEEEMIFEVLAK